MMVKIITIVFAFSLMFEQTFAKPCQENRRPAGYIPVGPTCMVPQFSGGAFKITSVSAKPTGVTVVGENLDISGVLQVSGSMPFAAAVELNGVVPSGGVAAVNYECGSSNIGANPRNCGMSC